MTQEEIKFNEKCVKFLKYKKLGEHYELPEHLRYYSFEENSAVNYALVKHLKFHSDCNWIIEVVEAIEKLGYDVVIAKKTCSIWVGGTVYSSNDKKMCETKKEAVVQAINQFLIWYEENK